MSVYRPKYRDRKTGEVKEQRVWWFHFTFAGRHIQESSKSTRKTIATEAEEKRHKELERAINGLPSESSEQRVRRVTDVLRDYAKAYSTNHRKESLALVTERSVHIRRILDGLMLSDITASRVIEYMKGV
jgi:hypothetical protein